MRPPCASRPTKQLASAMTHHLEELCRHSHPCVLLQARPVVHAALGVPGLVDGARLDSAEGKPLEQPEYRAEARIKVVSVDANHIGLFLVGLRAVLPVPDEAQTKEVSQPASSKEKQSAMRVKR